MCVQAQRSMKEAMQVGCTNLDKLPEELRLKVHWPFRAEAAAVKGLELKSSSSSLTLTEHSGSALFQAL